MEQSSADQAMCEDQPLANENSCVVLAVKNRAGKRKLPVKPSVNNQNAQQNGATSFVAAAVRTLRRLVQKKPSNDVKGPPSNDNSNGKAREKRKLKVQNEQSTSKRIRQQYQPFQSPNVATPVSNVKAKEDKIVIYNLNDFLAVRNESNSFFLCRAKQTIYKNGKKIKILWYNNDKDANVYCPDFIDVMDFECILTNIRVVRLEKGQVSIPEGERQRVLNILQRAINVEKGINEPPDPHKVLSDGLDISIIGEVEEDEIINKIKNNHGRKGKLRKESKMTNGEASEIKKEQVSEVCKEIHDQHVEEDGMQSSSTSTKISSNENPDNNQNLDDMAEDISCNKLLRINNQEAEMKVDVNNEEKDVVFETKENLPFISNYVSSKLLIRAVLLKDYNYLRSLINEENVSATVHRSAFIKRNSLHYSLESEDVALVDLLVKIQSNPKHNQQYPYIDSMELYHSELSIDSNSYQIAQMKQLNSSYVKFAIKNGISLEFLMKIQSCFENGLDSFNEHILLTIRSGNYELASFLSTQIAKKNNNLFNSSHLKFLSSKIDPNEISAELLNEYCNEEWKLYPIHIVAANPDPYFFNIVSHFPNQLYKTDSNGWMPIHYAAVCKTFFNLQNLLNIGISSSVVNFDGNTPLHLATYNNCFENVRLIISSDSISSPSLRSYNKKGWTPIHIASKKGFIKIIQLFIESKIDVDIVTSNNSGELTPLMIASKYGHLNIVKLLISHGANINLFDKKNRGALTYAVINGHSSIMNLLLEYGANPSFKDIFSNNLFHYALAYGWYNCYEVLLKINLNLKDTNTFGLTALCAAFMKGHIGLIENILTRNILSVNVPVNDTGITLVMLTFSLFPNETLLEYLKMFVGRFKSDLLKTDYDGNNTLHYLLRCEAKHKNTSAQVNEIIRQSLDILLQNGCDSFSVNAAGVSPILFALQNDCFISFKKFFAEHHKSVRFQQILSNSEHFFPLIITHLCDDLNEISLSNGKFLQNISNQNKNFHTLLKKLSLKTNKNGDIPIEFFLKNTKNLSLNYNENVEKELLDFFEFLLTFHEVKFLEDISLLHLAAKYAIAPIVQQLIKLFPHIDILDEANLTPLATAIQHKNSHSARVLIESGANIHSKIGEESCFLYELKNDTFKLVPVLIDSGVNVNEVDSEMNTALHLICQNATSDHCLQSVQLLIDKGIDINCLNKFGQTALHVAFNSNRITQQLCSLFELLLRNNIDISLKDYDGYNALHYLFMSSPDSASFIDLLKAVNFKTDLDRNSFVDRSRQNLLHYGSRIGAADCLSYLLTFNSPNALDCHGCTPLALAIINSHKDCVYNLLKNDFTLFTNYKCSKDGKDKVNLIKEIVKNDWKDIMFEIIEKAKSTDRLMELVQILIESECVSYAILTMDLLFASSGLDSKFSRQILLEFSKHASSEVEKSLQKKFLAQIDSQVLDQTILELFLNGLANWNHVLCNELIEMRGIRKILTGFQEKQINPLSSIFQKLTTDHVLSEEIKSLILLLIQDIDINTLALYPITEVTNSTKRYVALDAINQECSIQYSPLIVAIINHHYPIVKWLLSLKTDGEYSVDLNFCDSKVRTPIMHAIFNNDIKIINLLLDRNSDLKTNPTNVNSIDLTSKDINNRTLYHHLICPFDCYNFARSIEIFELLWSMLDSKHKTADFTKELITFARQSSAFNLLPLLEKPSKPDKNCVNNGSRPRKLYDFKADHDSLLKQNTPTSKEVPTNGDFVQNGICNHSKWQIIKDESTNTPYDVTFTKLDNLKSSYIYNFYKIQLFTIGDKSALYIRWGQVGSIGNLHKVFYDSKEEAIADFKKIFSVKSGNEWLSVEQFTPNENKYKMVDTKRFKKHIWIDLNVNVENFMELKSNLPLKLRTLVLTLIKSNIEFMKQFASYEKYNLNSTLLNFCNENLLKIYDVILKQKAFKTANKKENVKFFTTLIDLSEEFYSSIQIYGNQFDKLKPIVSLSDFYEKCSKVHVLNHAMFCKELLYCAQNKMNANPIDYIYDSFRFELKSVEMSEFKFVELYLKSSIEKYQDLSVYKIVSEESSPTDKPHLLWHIVENYEFFSLLVNGFQKKPVRSEIKPQFVTNGVKLTNKIEQSNSHSYLLLCEVNLDQTLEIDSTEVIYHSMLQNKNCLSIQKSKSDQSQRYLSWNGYTAPIPSSDGPQEFIYFDVDRIKPRFLIEYSLL